MRKNVKEILEAKGLVSVPGEVGNYLASSAQKEQIEVLRGKLKSLKQYCNIIPMETAEGIVLDEIKGTTELNDITEMGDQAEEVPTFSPSSWELRSYGDLTAVKNSVISDEDFNIIDFVGNKFIKKAVRLENRKILEVLGTAAVVAGTDYKSIVSALNKELDPLLVDSSIIITNQDGFDYLDSVVDKNGDRLLVSSVTRDGIKLFKGKQEVETISNDSLPTSETGEIPFFVGSVFNYVRFFDRNEYQIDLSLTTGFSQDTTYLRMFERIDIKAGDEQAVKLVKLTIPA